MIEFKPWLFDLDARTSTQIGATIRRRGERFNDLSVSESPRSWSPSQGNYKGPILTNVEGSTGGSAEYANPRCVVAYRSLSDEFRIRRDLGPHHLPPLFRFFLFVLQPLSSKKVVFVFAQPLNV
jgi:hypothetical protein